MNDEATPSVQTRELLRFDRARLKALGSHLWRHFKQDRLLEVAASLSYTTLLALVPLFAVVFSFLNTINAFQAWSQNIQDFLFENFVPSVGAEVQHYMEGFLQSTSGLTALGFLLLFVTTLLLMGKIEQTFNRIWRVSVPRRLGNRLAMYWAVLTLTPLLMGAGLALTAAPVFARFGFDWGTSGTLRALGIFVFTWMAVTLAFFMVPNRAVQWRHAMIGATITTVLFQTAKVGFVAYASRANFNTLYQSLATVPIFLVWLYLSWIVLLLGASVTASLTTFSYRRASWHWTREQEFQLLYRLVGHLHGTQSDGSGVSDEKLLQLEEAASDSQLQRLLGDLHAAGYVHQDEDGCWFLARDLAHVRLSDLAQVGYYRLPLDGDDSLVMTDSWDRQLGAALEDLRGNGQDNLDRPLKSFYRAGGPES